MNASGDDIKVIGNAADDAIKVIGEMLETMPMLKRQSDCLQLAIQALKISRKHFELVAETIDTSFTDECFVSTLLKRGRTEEEARKMADEVFLLCEAVKQNKDSK